MIFVGAIAIGATVAGCGETPTQPSSGSASGTPVLTGTSPAQPPLSTSPQLLDVMGNQFGSGLVATIVKPDGQLLTYAAAAVRNLTPTSFEISVVLDAPGNYQLRVTNPSGAVSNSLNLPVGSALQGILTLTAVAPSTLPVNLQPQTIFVTGMNFDTSLQATLTAPGGAVSFYGPGLLAGLNATSFSLSATFDKVGAYSIVVSNNSSSISNALTIDVRTP